MEVASKAESYQMNQRRRVVHLRSCTKRSLMRPRFICATSSTMRRPSNIGLPMKERRKANVLMNTELKILNHSNGFHVSSVAELFASKEKWDGTDSCSAQTNFIQCIQTHPSPFSSAIFCRVASAFSESPEVASKRALSGSHCMWNNCVSSGNVLLPLHLCERL